MEQTPAAATFLTCKTRENVKQHTRGKPAPAFTVITRGNMP